MLKGHFTTGGHFIVLRGVQDGKILVADPASYNRSQKLWDLSIILNEASKRAGAGGPFWIIGLWETSHKSGSEQGHTLQICGYGPASRISLFPVLRYFLHSISASFLLLCPSEPRSPPLQIRHTYQTNAGFRADDAVLRYRPSTSSARGKKDDPAICQGMYQPRVLVHANTRLVADVLGVSLLGWMCLHIPLLLCVVGSWWRGERRCLASMQNTSLAWTLRDCFFDNGISACRRKEINYIGYKIFFGINSCCRICRSHLLLNFFQWINW